MLVGAIAAWCVFGPMIIDNGWVTGTLMLEGEKVTLLLSDPRWLEAKGDAGWFKELVTWLLWPGVAMMVTASLTAFAFSWRSVLAAFKGMKQESVSDEITDDVPKNVHLILIVVISVIAIVLQYFLFGIGWGLATFAVLLTFLLAIVAARVSGETGITPVGAMAKSLKLTFGVLRAVT